MKNPLVMRAVTELSILPSAYRDAQAGSRLALGVERIALRNSKQAKTQSIGPSTPWRRRRQESSVAVPQSDRERLSDLCNTRTAHSQWRMICSATDPIIIRWIPW